MGFIMRSPRAWWKLVDRRVAKLRQFVVRFYPAGEAGVAGAVARFDTCLAKRDGQALANILQEVLANIPSQVDPLDANAILDLTMLCRHAESIRWQS
jgi:hypothetical protein